MNDEDRKAYSRAYDARRRESKRIQDRLYNETHKEERRAYWNAYDAAHRQARTHAQTARRAKMSEEEKAARAQYLKKWRQANRTKVRQYHQDFDKKFPEKRAVRHARYVKRHPEQDRERVKKHHARKLGAPINDFTLTQWQEMKEHYHHRCVYCNKHSERLTQDHITPLSKGGSHTVSNIVPACRSCNSKKGTRGPLRPIQPLLLL
jgi:5-methylcytosine-specific restriction endonuclease McrA